MSLSSTEKITDRAQLIYLLDNFPKILNYMDSKWKEMHKDTSDEKVKYYTLRLTEKYETYFWRLDLLVGDFSRPIEILKRNKKTHVEVSCGTTGSGWLDIEFDLE